MKKILISICFLIFMYGCGSKKKITSVYKGYTIDRQESKSDTKKEGVNIVSTEKKETEQVKEVYDINTVVKYIFDTAGRVQSVTKTTYEKGSKNTNRDTESKIKDSVSVSINSSTHDTRSVESGTYSKDTYKEVKQKNPIWNWIGLGVLIVIVAFGVFKLRRI